MYQIPMWLIHKEDDVGEHGKQQKGDTEHERKVKIVETCWLRKMGIEVLDEYAEVTHFEKSYIV